ncbi:DNA-directed RNA polymerase subunit beta, partial [Patescibacteria group bacterium]|nr:DNA-directed RNA polymerase subunit beta [Patescibacteria group bacterium]
MAKKRLNLSNFELRDFPINLIEPQISSYKNFLKEGLGDLFKEISPIEDYTGESWIMEFGDVRLGDPKYSAKEAKLLGLSFDVPLYVKAKLINKKSGEIKEQELFVADLPLMTKRGSFVVNGNERVVVMQLVRAEGVLFVRPKVTQKKELFIVKLIPQRGKWLDFEINRYGVMSVQLVNKRPKILLTTLLRAIGYSTDDEIRKLLGDVDTGEEMKFVEETLKADSTRTKEEALIDIYSKLRPEDSINLEGAKTLLNNIFFNPRRFYLGRIGRHQLNKKLGTNIEVKEENYLLRKDDLVSVIRSLIQVNNGQIKPDDIDHLANRRVRGPGELVAESIREGMLQMEKNIRDRMSTYGADELITPSRLVNTRPVVGALNHFFGSSSLSRYMDQENILSELEIKRRITSGGEGGLTKQSATFSVRDVHSSHYSRFCPVETPEGPMIGIVSHMSIYARINGFGFLEAPYKKVAKEVKCNKSDLVGRILDEKLEKGSAKFAVGQKLDEKDIDKIIQIGKKTIKVKPFVTDQIEYLGPDEEASYKIGSKGAASDEDGNILDSTIFVRSGGGFKSTSSLELDFVDVNPGQIAGLGLALIPYAAHDDPTRTLMGSNMQRQAVPLLSPEAPVVGTGYEGLVAKSSRRAVYAEENCKVLAVDASMIEVEQLESKRKKKYKLDKFLRTNQNTSFNQTPRVRVGDAIKSGELLADGPSMDHGELALGRNITAAYMVYEGYNFEDALIISERLVKDDVLTSVHISEYIRDIRETQLGPEQITTDIPNVSTYALRNLNEEGIVRVGARVEPRDILVGIIAPKGETELTAEEKLLRAIFGEYARDVRDNSLRLPHGEKGIIIDTQVLDKEKGAKLSPGVLKQVKVWVARTHKISIGDKLTGRHGDKGCISRVLAEEDMPYMADGTPVDIILSSPLFIKRMNLGQLMETHVGRLAEQLGIRVAVPIFAD